MKRKLLFSKEAEINFKEISKMKSKKGLYLQLLKTLAYLEGNPRHPSLRTHEYVSLKGKNGEKIWEAYVQNDTPCAYRVFFHYGPDESKGTKRIPIITILAIKAHP